MRRLLIQSVVRFEGTDAVLRTWNYQPSVEESSWQLHILNDYSLVKWKTLCKRILKGGTERRMSIYHEGELAVQKQAGVSVMAQRVGGMIRPTIPYNMWHFIDNQSMVIVGSVDKDERVWASILTGTPGFIHLIDDSTLVFDSTVMQDYLLKDNLLTTSQIGLLFVDLEHRTRIRINGTARIRDGLIEFKTEQVYANCQKYIQSRVMQPTQPVHRQDIQFLESLTLSRKQIDWLVQSDTFFIASRHPSAGADVSHRGGMPGFVRVISEDRIEFPDYSGNMMFNTLGNIAANPHAGLLFIDFETGSTLHLTGEASIIWDKAKVSTFKGAERVVSFQIARIVEIQQALPFNFELQTYSRFNPQ